MFQLIAANGDVAENIGQANFSLTATGLTSDTTLMINATASDLGSGGLYLPTNLENVAADYSVQFSDADSDKIYNGTLVVDIHNDDIREFTGEIELTLNNDPQSPKTYVLGATTRGTIKVYDDDAPSLSIEPITARVTENDDVSADFKISSISSVNRYIPVRYQISSNSFVDDDGTIKEVYLDFSNGATSATLSIPVVNDENSEADDEIVLTLQSPNSIPPLYVLAIAPDNSARVTVYDDDSPPTISVASDSGDVFENVDGGEAKFDLSANGLTQAETLMINATPAEDGGDFLASTTTADFSVDFSDPDGDHTYTGELSVTLDNDSNREATADIKLTLNADTMSPATYQLGTITEGTLTVLDDDAPELSVSAISASIIEADNVTANFKVSAAISL